ncbi:MAG: chromosome segregation protein SMC [Aerococcus sp.]|nr:chromosome segregation protein SMC [Aerococcus sp.]
MYLKVIELIGFKSFAEKTRIELNADFTAIVGPNGSGKSNITEAIKWVLGEQSAKSLRGERMDDVIFAGSASKSRAQYAEVSLEFDNNDRTLALDQDVVRLTRRFTRKGESTYRLNGQQCRLKDITELMMDTGIGKHSFSVISQGRVEEIFNQKAEERRAIFEEAAGVTKYKAKKQEAERKLARTLDNQNRLDDIMSEIETRLTPLKEQRDTAMTYQEKKSALSEIEIALITVEIEAQSKAWELSKQELIQVEAGIRREKAALKTAHEALDEQQRIESAEEEKRETLHNELITLVQQIEQSQSNLELAKQRFAFQQKDQAQRQARLAELDRDRTTRTKAFTKANAALTASQQEVRDQKERLSDVTSALNALEAARTVDVEALRNQYFDALQRQNQLKNQLVAMEKDQSLREQKYLEQQHQQQQWEKEQRTLETAQKEAQEQLEQVKEALDSILNDYQAKAQSLKALNDQIQAVQKDYDQANQTYLQAKAKHESLRSLEENNEGFYFGVKNALKLKTKYAGIHGAVAQLMEVPAAYNLAVETALGGQMQNIITATGRVAEQVIQQLKQERGGRATFLPLDVMKPRTLSPNELGQAQTVTGYLGVLVDLVKFDAKYLPVMANLMGSTLVTKDLKSARQINQLLNRRVRVVSLEGDLVHAGGSLTGGMNRNNQQGAILERRQAIKAYAQKETELKETLATLSETREKLERQASQLTEALEAVKEAGTEARYQERSAKETLAQLTEQLSDVEKSLTGAQYEAEIHSEDQQSANHAQRQLENELQEATQTIAQLKAQIDSANASEETYQVEHATLVEKRQTIKTALAVAKAAVEQQTTAVLQAKEDVQQVEQAIQTLNDQAGTPPMDEATFKATERKQKEQLQQKIDRQQQLKQAQKTAKERQQQAQAAIERLSAQQETHNEALERYYQEQSTTQARISRYEVTIDTHLTHLREDYSLTFERAQEQSQLTLSVDEASQQVKRLKREIDQLGAVNLQAIAEYDAVKERYDFMATQRADVLAAVDNLKTTIATLDQEVSEKFKASFLAIQAAFEQIFPKLFGGGKATLTLSDPKQLLTTGIEIMAQPPGKKLQLMSLLSGGERSLTAIALLFAMIAVNPVPFSILDEVEAALDDANVERYGEYLQHYAEKTQFIVITHRKGTMEHANLLYGVTMEQAGISKLASVKLGDVDWPLPSETT